MSVKGVENEPDRNRKSVLDRKTKYTFFIFIH